MAKRAAKVVVADPQAAIRDEFIKQGSDPVIAKKALDDATGLSRGLWLSFLIFGTYLVITFAGVTHRDLLLETPIKLPVLNAPLPLVTFFWVAPILFVIFHLYLLLSLKLLADQVHHYLGAMAETGLDSDAQDRARLQLPNFVVVQVLGGTSAQLNSWAGWLMRFTAFLTLAAGPLILLLFAQLMFLPYHGWWVTMAQRLTVVLDLVFIWYFWRAITRPEREGLHVWGGAASVAVVVITFFGLMYPGEWFYGPLPKAVFVDVGFNGYEGNNERKTGLANTLDLTNIKLADDELINKLLERNSKLGLEQWDGQRILPELLRNRDFYGANFVGADLRKADFSGSVFTMASLGSASLQGTNLSKAKMHGASLSRASMQGSNLEKTEMRKARFVNASMQGARLDGAEMPGADLDGAQLQGASMVYAKLQGASFFGASLQGASLRDANLQGALFVNASLQVVALMDAKLQGASLRGAALQGASLDRTSLQGASLTGIRVWRTTGRPDLSLTDVTNLVYSPTPARNDGKTFASAREAYQNLVSSSLMDLSGFTLDQVKRRLTKIDPDAKEPHLSMDWNGAKQTQFTTQGFTQKVVEVLIEVACDAEAAPYVAPAIVSARFDDEIGDLGKEALPLVEALLAGCPGTEGMDQKAIDRLKELKKQFTSDGVAPENGEGK